MPYDNSNKINTLCSAANPIYDCPNLTYDCLRT